MKIAINQPYFSAYAGYYSLINAADIFVFYDCVQFARGGRVHRSQIHVDENFSGGWLTLPSEKQPQETLIKDIVMRRWGDDFLQGPYRMLLSALEADTDIKTHQSQAGLLCDFLWDHHRSSLKRCGIHTKIIRSSELNIPRGIKGQGRILRICKELGATQYINLPGGRDLYDTDLFLQAGVDLKFLITDSSARTGYLQAIASGDFKRFSEECMIARF